MQKIILKPTSSFEYKSLTEEAPLWISHYEAWARVLEKSFPQIRGYIAADSTKISDETSFLPIFKIRKPMKKPYWLSIPYSTICDPVIRSSTLEKAFLNTLGQHPLTRGCSIEIRTCRKTVASGLNYTSAGGYVNHQLSLDGDEEEIFRKFHKKSVQPRIRQSLKAGLTLRVASSMCDVRDFYRIYVSMRKEQGLPPQPYRFFTSMWQELYSTGNIDLLLAERDGDVIAASWALKNSWLYSLEYLARAGRNDKHRSAYFLNWHGIKRAIANGLQVVSFARTSLRNGGLNLYKSGWATKAIPYTDLISPPTAKKHREERLTYRLMRRYSSSLPTPLFRILGEIIYRMI